MNYWMQKMRVNRRWSRVEVAEFVGKDVAVRGE
jgi:hypothetical protein